MLQGKGTLALIVTALMLTTGLAGCAAPDAGGERATTCEDLGSQGAAAETPPGTTRIVPSEDDQRLVPEDLVRQDDEPVRLGFMLPLTGSLDDFGPDMADAVRLAVDEVNNETTFLNGRDVELFEGDTQSQATPASNNFQQLVQQGVVGVVGAASSGVTGSIQPTAVQEEVVLTTPASTSPTLTEGDNDGYFYRVPPPDSLQGRAMAQLLQDDGCETINIVSVNNDYGQGFADTLERVFENNGGEVNKKISYDEDSSSFSTEISQATSGDYDALVFIGYPGQAVPMFTNVKNDGELGSFPIYFSEGVKSQDFVTDMGNGTAGEWALRGFQGTTPAGSTNATDEFAQKFEDRYGDEPGLFAPESYDAALYMLLAMQAAGTSDPTEWRSEMSEVANPPGMKTHDLGQALSLLAAGQDIDWEGAANDLEWDENGEVISGTYAFWSVSDEGTIDQGEPFVVAE